MWQNNQLHRIDVSQYFRQKLDESAAQLQTEFAAAIGQVERVQVFCIEKG